MTSAVATLIPTFGVDLYLAINICKERKSFIKIILKKKETLTSWWGLVVLGFSLNNVTVWVDYGLMGLKKGVCSCSKAKMKQKKLARRVK